MSSVPAIERNEWVTRYFEILASGYAAQPPPPAPSPLKEKGRRKQSQAKNLLDALLGRADQVLALLDDLSIPFTNNQAERDLRMAKVQQKIAGTFRSARGATTFCRIRSYLSTMQKQGHTMLSALVAVFHRAPCCLLSSLFSIALLYRSLGDLSSYHRKQVLQQREQQEIDAAYKAVRSLRLKQTYERYFAEEVERKKRWRAYRYR